MQEVLGDEGRLKDRAFDACLLCLRRLGRDADPWSWCSMTFIGPTRETLDFMQRLLSGNRDTPLLSLIMTRPTLFEQHVDWGGDDIDASAARSEAARQGLQPGAGRGPAAATGRHPGSLARRDHRRSGRQPVLHGRAGEDADRRRRDRSRGRKLARAPRQAARRPRAHHADRRAAGTSRRIGARERTALQQAAVVGHVFWDQALAAVDPAARRCPPGPVAQAARGPTRGAERQRRVHVPSPPAAPGDLRQRPERAAPAGPRARRRLLELAGRSRPARRTSPRRPGARSPKRTIIDGEPTRRTSRPGSMPSSSTTFTPMPARRCSRWRSRWSSCASDTTAPSMSRPRAPSPIWPAWQCSGARWTSPSRRCGARWPFSSSALGDDHLDTARTLAVLGGCLQGRGEYAAAEPFFRQALEVRERVLGPEHPLTLGTWATSRTWPRSSDRLDEAEKLSRRVLQVRERIAGPETLETAGALTSLSEVLDQEGRPGRAPSRCCAGRFRFSSNGSTVDNPDVGLTMWHLAEALRLLGRCGEAEALARRTLEIWEGCFGPEHEWTAWGLICLAEVRLGAGRRRRGDRRRRARRADPSAPVRQGARGTRRDAEPARTRAARCGPARGGRSRAGARARAIQSALAPSGNPTTEATRALLAQSRAKLERRGEPNTSERRRALREYPSP